MNNIEAGTASRKQIAIRGFYTILFMFVFEVVKGIIQFTVIFQFIYLFAAGTQSESLRSFCSKLSAYAYRVIRYITLNDNIQPFPFSEIPKEMDLPVQNIKFE